MEVIPADDNEDDTTSIDFLGCRLQAISYCYKGEDNVKEESL